MTRLIDADIVIEKLKNDFDSSDIYTDKDQFVIDCISILNKAPTAEVHKKGKWIVAKQDYHGIHEIECPFCKYNKGRDFSAFITITFDVFPPFCEKCGADLRSNEE